MHWLDGIERVNWCVIGWPRSRLVDRRVGAEAQALVAVLRVPAGVGRRAVVGVNGVAGRAAAGAVVAGVIVRAEEAQQRIVEPRFLQAEEHGVGAQERAVAARAEGAFGRAVAGGRPRGWRVRAG